MTNKSKKFNQMISGFGEMLYANHPQNRSRYAQAWHDVNEDGVDLYIFHAGYEGLPADYKVSFDTAEELESEMRKFANFRHWVFRGW